MTYRDCYDQEIWPTKQKEFAMKARAFIASANRKGELVADLLAADISEQGVQMLVGITGLDWEGWEDAGRIAWTSEGKREAAYAAREKYFAESGDAAKDYEEAVASLWASETD